MFSIGLDFMYSNSQSYFMYNDGVEVKERNCTVKEKRLTTMTETVTTTTTTMEEVERANVLSLSCCCCCRCRGCSVRRIIYLWTHMSVCIWTRRPKYVGLMWLLQFNHVSKRTIAVSARAPRICLDRENKHWRGHINTHTRWHTERNPVM